MTLRNQSSAKFARWLSPFTLAALAGCSAPTMKASGDPETSAPLGDSSQALVAYGNFFSSPTVRFCFDTPGFDDFKARFVSGAVQTFQNFTNVSLDFVGQCADIDTSGGVIHVTLVAASGTGQRSYTDYDTKVMHIFDSSGPVTWAHELTHALGFRHTQDANGSLCTLQAVTKQDAAIGPYDPQSLMNYCGTGGPKVFSDLDLMGIDLVYGAPGRISIDTSGTMYRHRLYRKADGSMQDYRCTLQAGQLAAFTGLHGAPAGSPGSTYNNAPEPESSFSSPTPTDVGPCAYPPGFYQVNGAYYMVAGDQIEVNSADKTDELHVNPGKVCRIADDAQRPFFSVDMLVHPVDPSTNLWLGRSAMTMDQTPPCAWGDGFYRIDGTDPVYRLSGTNVAPAICQVQNPAQLSQYQQVGRVVTEPQPPLAGEVNVAVPPHVVPAGTALSSLSTGRLPAGDPIPDCPWPDGLYTSDGLTYSVVGATYCHVVDAAQLAALHGPTPSDVTGEAFFQGPTGQTYSGSGSNGQSGANCLATYTFPVTAGASYTVSTVPNFTGDTYVKVTGACACANDDFGGGLGSQCTCTATSTGTATLCASSYGGSAASWNYTVSGGGSYTSLGDCPWPSGLYQSENGRFQVQSPTSVCFIQNDAELAALNPNNKALNDVTNDPAFYQFWQTHYAGLCPWPDGLYTLGDTTYAIGTGDALPHDDVIAHYGIDKDPIGDICALVNPTQAKVLGSTRGTSGMPAWPLFNNAPVVVPSGSVLTVGRTIVNKAQRVPECPWPNGNYQQMLGPGSDPAPYKLTRTAASLYDGTITYDCQRNATYAPYPLHLLAVAVPQAIWQCPLDPAQMPPLTVTCSDNPCTSNSTLSVHYEGMTGSINDWIAPVPLGQPSDSYVGKQYLSGGQTSGDLVFRSPGPGTWTFRAFINGSYVLRAESAAFTIVTPNPGLIHLSCPDTPCTDASTLVASYTNAPTANDPLGDGYTVQLMPPGGAWNSLLAYQYSQPTSATLSFEGGSLAFRASTPSMPAFPVTGSADIAARIYLRDTGALLAESASLRLWPNLTVTCSTPLCAAGDTVTVSYHNLPAVNSWIELVPQGSPHRGTILIPNSQGPYFTYTNGLLTGSVTFVVQAGSAGSWVARAYKQIVDPSSFFGVYSIQTGLDSAPISLAN